MIKYQQVNPTFCSAFQPNVELCLTMDLWILALIFLATRGLFITIIVLIFVGDFVLGCFVKGGWFVVVKDI
ncbi:hypothetical protein M6B38_342320 [Iris pallida]|uniref:Transmembrane protein n=1 Tax=Iris pallida TaxID=29817 RepID=A0AAX6GXA4_IRIPA|nr:hypothetical protein M6B38_342320 [Iris pallida]